MTHQSMDHTAQALVAPGKGILAADESTPTMAKRLAGIGLESTEPLRRAYRELLFTTEGLSEYISGVILYDETIRQRTADGRPFAEVLSAAGLIPGIKVDAGTKPLAAFPDEVVTDGLDGLRDRMKDHGPRSVCSSTQRGERLEHHEGRPEDALHDREDVLPEAVRLLPEVHPSAEDPEAVDRASTGCARTVAHRRHPLLEWVAQTGLDSAVPTGLSEVQSFGLDLAMLPVQLLVELAVAEPPVDGQTNRHARDGER